MRAPALRVIESHLARDALVVADLSEDDPDLRPYLERVRDPGHGYFSTCVPLDDGVHQVLQQRVQRPDPGGK